MEQTLVSWRSEQSGWPEANGEVRAGGMLDGGPRRCLVARVRWDFCAIATAILAANGQFHGYLARSDGNSVQSNAIPGAHDRAALPAGHWRKNLLQLHLAIYLLHVVFGFSQRQAGLSFFKHRTTVRYACARIEDARDDIAFDCALDALTAALNAHAASFNWNDGPVCSDSQSHLRSVDDE